MEIRNKTIILTGAARIGQTVAQYLLSKGTNLTVSYLTKKPAFDFEHDSSKVLFFKADLTKADDVAQLVAATKQTFNRIDGLVHMAATYYKTPWVEINDETMKKSMWSILRTAVLASKAAGDELLKNPGEVKGKIILISDWSVLSRPYKDYLPYNVAKSAVVGLTKSLAKELAPGIMVNCIAPGPVLKPEGLSHEENEEVMKNTPLARWGGADEVAKAVTYLLDADFITGQILYVDGGRSIA